MLQCLRSNLKLKISDSEDLNIRCRFNSESSFTSRLRSLIFWPIVFTPSQVLLEHLMLCFHSCISLLVSFSTKVLIAFMNYLALAFPVTLQCIEARWKVPKVSKITKQKETADNIHCGSSHVDQNQLSNYMWTTLSDLGSTSVFFLSLYIFTYLFWLRTNK